MPTAIPTRRSVPPRPFCWTSLKTPVTNLHAHADLVTNPFDAQPDPLLQPLRRQQQSQGCQGTNAFFMYTS